MEKKIYTAKQVLYRERMERARMMALFFDVLCNHEKAVYRFSRYSVRGVALAFNEAIPLAQVAHTPEEWCHIWETVYVKLKAYTKDCRVQPAGQCTLQSECKVDLGCG